MEMNEIKGISITMKTPFKKLSPSPAFSENFEMNVVYYSKAYT